MVLMNFPDQPIRTERNYLTLELLTRENLPLYVVSLLEGAGLDYARRFLDPGLTGQGAGGLSAAAEPPSMNPNPIARLIEGQDLNMSIILGSGETEKSQAGGVRLRPINQTIAEVECWLKNGETHKGYAAVATRAIINYGRSQGFSSIIARIPTYNLPALALAERLNFMPRRRLPSGLILFEQRRLKPASSRI